MLFKKLFEKGIYCVGAVRRKGKNMAKMKSDKDMNRRCIDFKYAGNIAAAKWFDNRTVILIDTCLNGCNKVSSVSRRMKGQGTKFAIACRLMIKEFNFGKGDVRLMDQKTTEYKVNKSCRQGVIITGCFLILRSLILTLVKRHIVH